MKSIILAAAVTAFELAFVISLASPPAPSGSALVREASQQDVAQGARPPVPCTPRG